jgi:hypothetical protein
MFGWFSRKKEVIDPNPQLTEELHRASERNQKIVTELVQAKTALSSLNAEKDALQSKIREQNEADLLLVSMRITQRILAGEKKEALTSDLYAQQQLMAMSGQYQNPYGSFGQSSGLGLHSLFGAMAGWGGSPN